MGFKSRLNPRKDSLPGLCKRGLAFREGGAGFGEGGRAEFGENLNGAAGVGPGLGGLTLAHEGLG